MDIQTLCEGIGLPEEVWLRVQDVDISPLRELSQLLIVPESAKESYQKLAAVLGQDDMAMLACQLDAAVRVYRRYRDMDIPDAVYFDTMKCFPRFLEETRRRTGEYRYDRAWWSYRQVSMTLFRIGELEYELLPGERAISIHIPSDACFAPEAVDRSFAAWGAFLKRFFPACREFRYICESWLLSPELGKLLMPGSHILSFQRRFTLLREYPGETDFFQWLFEAGQETPPEALPERTSLQRAVKAHLLSGGHIGAALGVMK